MGLALSALGSFSRRNHGSEKPGLRAQYILILKSCLEAFLEYLEMQFGNVVVSDEDVGRRWEGADDSFGDVRNQMKATVDRILSENGHFENICLCHLLEWLG